MSIQPLPQEVIAQIKSSIAIISLNAVICELFKNSLDARATRIDITVDQAKGACIVEDDGFGILPSEFGEHSGLGKLYHSSKLHNTNPTHGRRGTFLASLSAMSVLSIVSHHQSHRSHNMITMHKSAVVARQTPAEPRQHLTSFSNGTRVTVRDLFGNMPVRVKQRALIAEKHKTSTKDWDELKHDVVALLLAWPEKVTVTVRDLSSNQMLNLRSPEALNTALIDQPTRISSVCSILSQASFILPDEKGSWVPVGASTSKFRISGTISLDPSATKYTQFISYEIQPVTHCEGSSILHDEINRLFVNSAFGNYGETEELAEAERQRRAKDQRFKSDGYTNKELKGVKKGVDRWPMYCINIEHLVTSRRNSIGLEVGKILNSESDGIWKIMELLQAMVLQFLTSNNFRPKSGRGKRSKRVRSPSPSKQHASISLLTSPAISRGIIKESAESWRTKSSFDQFGSNVKLPSFRSSTARPDSAFETWSRGKSGVPVMLNTKEMLLEGPEIYRPATAPPSAALSHSPQPGSTTNYLALSTKKATDTIWRPFEDVDIPRRRSIKHSSSKEAEQHAPQPKKPTTEAVDEEVVKWINPVTKAVSLVNKRTGLIVPVTKSSASMSSTLSLVLKQRLNRIPTTKEPSPWISNILKTWTNPTFAPTEASIPQIRFEGPDAPSQLLLHGRHHHCTQVDIDRAFNETVTGLSGQISKSALRNAEIISQVDKKFILVKLATTGVDENNRVLVLIDQHAADERIRIESLMEELCTPTSEESREMIGSGVLTAALLKPLVFEISSRDFQLFQKHKSHFTQWGIIYQLPKHNLVTKMDAKGRAIQHLTATHLPPGILERCKIDTRLLIDMIRTEVYKVDQQAPTITSATSLSTSWLSHTHSCPQGLIDMLKSRACRSAIMFNDVLDNRQCEMLVQKLSKCMLPFQCAHGRPSLVPLVDVGSLRGMGGLLAGEDGGDFGREMKRWKQSMNKC